MGIPGMSDFMNGQGSTYDFGSSATAGGDDKFGIGGVNYRTGGSNGLAISTPVLLGLAAAAALVAIVVIKGK